MPAFSSLMKADSDQSGYRWVPVASERSNLYVSVAQRRVGIPLHAQKFSDQSNYRVSPLESCSRGRTLGLAAIFHAA